MRATRIGWLSNASVAAQATSVSPASGGGGPSAARVATGTGKAFSWLISVPLSGRKAIPVVPQSRLPVPSSRWP